MFTEFVRNLLARLNAGAAQPESGEAVEYKGCSIRPTFRRDGSQWLTAGVISKQFADSVKEHHFIRSETHGSKADAGAHAVFKAKQIIDERGDKLFDQG